MPEIRISAKAPDGGSAALSVEEIPDTCPVCHYKIKPELKYAWYEPEGDLIQVVFLCPGQECRNLFLSYYPKNQEAWRLSRSQIFRYEGSSPYKTEKRTFPPEIESLSASFCQIFNEAQEAEQRGLKNICGAGYRRALEFLIKDYLIKEKPEEQKAIEGSLLGSCINKYIDSEKIKDCAKRAAWLGNDLTHYYKKWKEKDLTDLKSLIQLTVNWIQDEYLTRKIKEDMPEG